MKYQNALGKYNRLSYFINPYGLTTMYFLHKVIIKVVTKRDSVKPQSKTNRKLDPIPYLHGKQEFLRKL